MATLPVNGKAGIRVRAVLLAEFKLITNKYTGWPFFCALYYGLHFRYKVGFKE